MFRLGQSKGSVDDPVAKTIRKFLTNKPWIHVAESSAFHKTLELPKTDDEARVCDKCLKAGSQLL